MSEPLLFFGKKKEGRELSNFWEGEVIVDGRVYACGEAAFHGSKYVEVGNAVANHKMVEYGRRFEIDGDFGELSGGELKRKGGKKGMALSGAELAIWDSISTDVQRKICRSKLETDDEVLRCLSKSGDRLLVHPAMRCSLEKVVGRKWEGRVVDGKVVGGNRLGQIWMDLRRDLNIA